MAIRYGQFSYLGLSLIRVWQQMVAEHYSLQVVHRVYSRQRAGLDKFLNPIWSEHRPKKYLF